MFFQNVIDQEFRANWVLGDRQYVIEFICPPNVNQSGYQLAWNPEPYNFSTYNTLTINYAWDIGFKNYSSLSVNVAGTVPAATKASEVAAALNATPIFAEMFVANVVPAPNINVPYMMPTVNPPQTVLILAKSGRIKPEIRLWITNAGAEQLLRFNMKAGVSEMPGYMARHTITNRFAFPDSLGCLIQLDNTDPTVDEPIIVQAGFNPSAMQADWQLLRGRSGLFNFQKLTVDDSNRITQIIEYPAGAQVGDFSRLIEYVYSGANTNPSQITEQPYTLTADDLVTP